MGKVMAVLSGKGGTGKTTVCAGLALELAAQGCRVLCIDLDVGLRNLDIALGMAQVPALSFPDVSEGGASLLEAARHPGCEALSFLTAPVGRRPEELDQEAFARMMDYECLIYGLRALLWGLPVSALVTYAIYRTMAKTISTGFYIPWYSVAIAVGSVFVVVFATMLYATRRIRRENPIDALKQENL